MATVVETPMLKQYQEIKSKHTDAILFFRLGDFYEMFLDDAIVASKALNLTLTGRGKDENRIPMCGIPYHAAENYIAKLITQGHKVAICEQVEEATPGKGLTKREVVKIITPGTILSGSILDEKENSYILAVVPPNKQGKLFCSVLDISTGEFRLFDIPSLKDLDTIVANFPIKEILTAADFNYAFPPGIMINHVYFVSVTSAKNSLQKFFHKHALHAFGIESLSDAFPAAWALINYVTHTQKQPLTHITKLLPWKRDRCMIMDKVTMKNLELTESRDTHGKTGTLFWVLDYTKTAMGARNLKLLIKNPSTEIPTLEKRLDAIESLLGDLLSREEIREILTSVYDLERIIARISTQHDNPRDCLALAESLGVILPLSQILPHLHGEIFEKLSLFFKKALSPKSGYQTIVQLIERSISPDSPTHLKDGGVILPGFSKELDALMLSFTDVKTWISELEPKERQKTGIKSLKVGFNKISGYYIEVPTSQIQNIPAHYIRKQTLANAERYITPELKEKENVLLHGEDKQRQLEISLYRSIAATIQNHFEELQTLSLHLARLDTLQSLATAAQKNNYTRPKYTTSHTLSLEITEGRHPILERNTSMPFIPNSLSMGINKNRFILLTGPNMAGKSTLMRQIALIVVMAQIGSFVSASKLTMSMVDQLFTRIGALDNLYFGQSTFMVEMLETATIINNATANSLVILDEVGRGTSTYDGMSIACAVSEHLHNVTGARTLFATHYHELTALEDRLTHCANYKMEVKETDKGIVFTHLCVKGPADKSYGVHVAQMAGLPNSIIKRAEALLTNLESQGATVINHTPQQLQLF